eukprot:8222591-Pyramimonas_sp.AAC.1
MLVACRGSKAEAPMWMARVSPAPLPWSPTRPYLGPLSGASPPPPTSRQRLTPASSQGMRSRFSARSSHHNMRLVQAL